MARPRNPTNGTEPDSSTDVFEFSGENPEQKANAVLGAVSFENVERIRVEVTTRPGPDLEHTPEPQTTTSPDTDDDTEDDTPTLNQGTQLYDSVMAVVESDSKWVSASEVAQRKETWNHHDEATSAASGSLQRAEQRGFLEKKIEQNGQKALYRVADEYRRTLYAEADEDAVLCDHDQ